MEGGKGLRWEGGSLQVNKTGHFVDTSTMKKPPRGGNEFQETSQQNKK